jgi:hypothetical protein
MIDTSSTGVLRLSMPLLPVWIPRYLPMFTVLLNPGEVIPWILGIFNHTLEVHTVPSGT